MINSKQKAASQQRGSIAFFSENIFFHPDYTVGIGISPIQQTCLRALPPVRNLTLPRRYTHYTPSSPPCQPGARAVDSRRVLALSNSRRVLALSNSRTRVGVVAYLVGTRTSLVYCTVPSASRHSGCRSCWFGVGTGAFLFSIPLSHVIRRAGVPPVSIRGACSR